MKPYPENMLQRFRKIISRWRHLPQVLSAIERRQTDLLLLLGKSQSTHLRQLQAADCFPEAEFKVFSQFGDDGIIQYLLQALDIAPQTFIEFGVEDYTEANTRFLLMNNNWRGLVMDGSGSHIEAIRQSSLYWKHDLTPVHAWITPDNINTLIADSGFSGKLGILSIDVDGNDFYVWQAIHVVEPLVVIAEYNSVFGPDLPISIPQQDDFCRTQAHYSNLYWGCSLSALHYLASKKGYALIGCNSAGNNAYFVRKDHLGPFQARSPQEAFVESRFRESRNSEGALTFVSGKDRLDLIKALPVYQVITGKTHPLSELLAAS